MNYSPVNETEAASTGMVLRECLRAARVIARCMGGRLAEAGLTPAQLEVLDALRQREGIPLHELRDALCCVGSNVTALVDRMERDGLVERRRDGEDRRVVRLYLGAAGRSKLAQLEDADRCCAVAPDALTPAERSTLMELLRKLVAHLGCACARPAGPSALPRPADKESDCE